MDLQLLKGTYTKQEAMTLLAKLIDIKIKFQEEKIKNADHEEDIKMREARIKELQKNLYEARIYIERLNTKELPLTGQINL
jgi:hypothetical protein